MSSMRASYVLALSLTACGVLVGACGKEKKEKEEATHETTGAALNQPPEAVPITEAARKEAAEIFASRCTTCHGPSGEGNGPASKGLNPQPRNFHDATWQGGVTNEHIDRIIQYGGAAVGKSPGMPPNPDLASKPEVVAALREHVRSLKSR